MGYLILFGSYLTLSFRLQISVSCTLKHICSFIMNCIKMIIIYIIRGCYRCCNICLQTKKTLNFVTFYQCRRLPYTIMTIYDITNKVTQFQPINTYVFFIRLINSIDLFPLQSANSYISNSTWCCRLPL